jgi:hypothetical protein
MHYQVRFFLSGIPRPTECPAVDIKTLTVSAASASQDYTFTPVPQSGPPWHQSFVEEVLGFSATSSSTTVTFTSTTYGCAGPILDDVSVTTAQPTTKDQCKDGGWQHYTDSQGSLFKNQGDCVSFVATGGKNLGNG